MSLSLLTSLYSTFANSTHTTGYSLNIPANTNYVIMAPMGRTYRVTTATLNGVTASFQGQYVANGTDQPNLTGQPGVEIWTLSNPSTGTQSISVVYAGGLNDHGIVVHCFQDTIGTPSVRTCMGRGGVTTSGSLSVPSATNDIVAGATMQYQAATSLNSVVPTGVNVAAPSAFSAVSTGNAYAGSYATGASTVTMAWSYPNTNGNVQMVVSLTPATVAAGGTTVTRNITDTFVPGDLITYSADIVDTLNETAGGQFSENLTYTVNGAAKASPAQTFIRHSYDRLMRYARSWRDGPR